MKAPERTAGLGEYLDRWRTALLLVVALAPVGAYFLAEAVRMQGDFGFPLDDSWIHLQFARNLAAGNGLAYNPGELVTASTAPLWTALASILFFLPGNLVLWTKAFGVALHVGVVFATYRLSREIGLSGGLAWLATAVAALTDWMLWAALSGMEIPLFTLISLWGLILHLRERRDPARPPLALGLFGLAVLARPEGACLAVLAVADRLLAWKRDSEGRLAWQRPPWRQLAIGVGLAILAAVPALAFQKLVGGSPFPSTFGAKTQGSLSWPPQPFDLFIVISMFFLSQPVVTLFAPGGLALLAQRLGRTGDRGLLPAAWVFGLPLVYSLLRTPGDGLPFGNFGRYYFPLLPLVAVLGMLGLRPLAEGLTGRWKSGPWRTVLCGALLVLLFWPTWVAFREGSEHYTQNVADVRASDVEMAYWMRDHLPPDAVVAVEDVGAMKFFTENRLVDMAGLITPEIQSYVAAAISEEDPRGDEGILEFLELVKPDFIISYPTWHPNIIGNTDFKVVHHIAFPGNITMGGDELFVLLPPWSRFEFQPASPPPAQPAAEPAPKPGAPEAATG